MLSNLFGALGIGANAIIYQQKSGKKLLLFKLISDILWASHYFLLNANTAAAAGIIGIFRETVFYNQDKKWAKSKLWLVFFQICSIVSAFLTWKSIFSILPAVASVISVFSFWKNNPKLSRILAFPMSAAMLTYDITCLSYMGIVNEVLSLLSAAAGIIRFSKIKN